MYSVSCGRVVGNSRRIHNLMRNLSSMCVFTVCFNESVRIDVVYSHVANQDVSNLGCHSYKKIDIHLKYT